MNFGITELYGIGVGNRGFPIISPSIVLDIEPPLWVEIPWKKRFQELPEEVLFRDVWRVYRVYCTRLKRQGWQCTEDIREWSHRVFNYRADEPPYWGDFQVITETKENLVMTLLVNVRDKAKQV